MSRPASNQWSADESHPPTELLFLAMEGELAGQEAARVQKHVEVCWQCRAQWEKWQEATTAFVDYRTRLQEAGVSAPPSGWSRFRLHLRRIASEHEQAHSIFPLPIRRILTASWETISSNRPIWAGLAFASLAVAVFVYLSSVPAVSAKELLMRAVAQEKPLVQKIRIHTESRQYVRETGKPGVRRSAARADADETRLATLFQQANLDWDNPLSARSFETWRNRLTNKTDRVYAETNALTLETTTGEGPVHTAALTVRSTDFHPIGETIRFSDAEEVEITELEARPVTASEIAEVSAQPEQAEPPPAPKIHRVLPMLPSTAELEAAEVTARVRLHQLGADLGEQIEIEQTKDSVRVSGVVDSNAEKEEISGALKGVPHVRTVLSSPEEVPLAGLEQALRTPPSVANDRQPPLLQSWLEQWYPDPADRHTYANQILAESRECLKRAYALQHLAGRYPTLENPEISAIAKDHLLVLQDKWQMLLKEVAPALEVPPGQALVSDGSWADDVHSLLGAMKSFDANLVVLFVGKEVEAEPGSASMKADFQGILTDSGAQAQTVTQAIARVLQMHQSSR
jgi:hypothetical protein